MRILIVATSSQGGAGIAALRSFEALKESGLDVTFMSLDLNRGACITEPNLLKKALAVFQRKSITVFQRFVVQNSKALITSISFDSISRIYKNIFTSYDVIHIHAFYNVTTIDEIAKLSTDSKKVILTLHDERLFTGGCHYSGECTGYQNSCKNCPLVRGVFKALPQYSLKTTLKSLQSANQIEFVTPSSWLAEKAHLSAALKARSIHVISNPIPEIFSPTLGKRTSASIGNLSIGFNAYSVDNPLKGFSTLRGALEMLSENDKSKIHLKVASQSVSVTGIEGVRMDSVAPNSDRELREFYESIDLLVVPSLQDNSPSVVGEALASGTPVFGSNVGGIPEILERFEQYVFASGDVEDLSRRISDALQFGLPSIDHDRARFEFSASNYARRITEVYSL
jgi:glycosyltransferase involved in cell wall biosynthesis